MDFLSLTQARTFLACGYAWRLRYREGHLPRVSASAWFGRLMHVAIRRAYAGSSLDEAIRAVWSAACPQVADDLEQLIAADTERAPRRRKSDEVVAIEQRLADYQRSSLAHLRWGKTQTLADFFRRAVSFGAAEGEILLSSPILVEGLPLDRLGEDGDGEQYGLLTGEIGGVPIRGVPDVVAARNGTFLVGDYKTGRPSTAFDVGEDAQIAIYLALLKQNGVIPDDAVVEGGHIVLGDHGEVAQVWTSFPPQRLHRLLSRIAGQLQAMEALISADICIPRKGMESGLMSPCATCDVAHVCDI